MAPRRPCLSSAYLGAYTDKSGDWLDGGRSYKLHIPPNAPAKMFWSVTLYDVDTRSLLVNDQKIADRSSRMDLTKNPRQLGGHLLRPRSADGSRSQLDPDRSRPELVCLLPLV
jgi:hypothetical protein